MTVPEAIFGIFFIALFLWVAYASLTLDDSR
jgi:hypothetical protein